MILKSISLIGLFTSIMFFLLAAVDNHLFFEACAIFLIIVNGCLLFKEE